ncbi:hypothetical protein ACWCQB_33980 [Streptomyces hirsutus]
MSEDNERGRVEAIGSGVADASDVQPAVGDEPVVGRVLTGGPEAFDGMGSTVIVCRLKSHRRRWE